MTNELYFCTDKITRQKKTALLFYILYKNKDISIISSINIHESLT